MKRIAVTGGKGGTGKSTVATALAAELARDSRVLLVDADVDCPNDHLLLGIERERVETVYQRIPEWNLEKCIGCGKCAGACKYNAIAMVKEKPVFMQNMCSGCGACKIVCPGDAITWGKKEIGRLYSGKAHGIDFLSGELREGEPVSEFVVSALNRMVRKVEEKYDFIIVDTSAGTHCDVISALQGADIALAVTEPTPLGAHDLALIIRLLKVLGTSSEIILNRAGIGDAAAIERIAEKEGKEIAARIPYSKEIMEAYSNGIPIKHRSIEGLKELVCR